MQICVSKLFVCLLFCAYKNTVLKLSKRDDIKPKAYALKGLFYEGFLRLRFGGRPFFLGGGGGGRDLLSEFYGVTDCLTKTSLLDNQMLWYIVLLTRIKINEYKTSK